MDLIFDLGGVLIDWDPERFVNEAFSDLEEGQRPMVIAKVFASSVWREFDEGLHDWSDAAEMLSQECKVPVKVMEYFLEKLPEFLMQLDKGVRLLKRVREKGHRTFVISNYVPHLFAIIRKRFVWFNAFDGMAVSGFINISKPSPEIFTHLLETYQLNPANCVFLDDSLANVDAAKSLGIQSILYQNTPLQITKVYEFLNSLGVSVSQNSPLQVNSIAHFDTDNFTGHVKRIPDDIYGQCLDSVVKACCDLLIVNSRTDCVLLGKRRIYPQKDWWFGAGGRMLPGERPCDSGVRIMSRELGMQARETFELVGCYSFIWGIRRQEPANNGCADISVVLSYEIGDEEISCMRECEDEYEEHVWVPVQEMVSSTKYHPALHRACKDLQNQRILRNALDIAGRQDELVNSKILVELLRQYKHNLE